MKRHANLAPWSREHHHALVLANRAITATGDIVEQLLISLPQTFTRELEPHFRAEEDCLLPALRKAGQSDAVTRTFAEHAELRRLAGTLDTSTLVQFGRLLADHVRFEERELFPLAEKVLTADFLARLGNEQSVAPSKCS